LHNGGSDAQPIPAISPNLQLRTLTRLKDETSAWRQNSRIWESCELAERRDLAILGIPRSFSGFHVLRTPVLTVSQIEG
jgi:hypothetical protein